MCVCVGQAKSSQVNKKYSSVDLVQWDGAICDPPCVKSSQVSSGATRPRGDHPGPGLLHAISSPQPSYAGYGDLSGVGSTCCW